MPVRATICLWALVFIASCLEPSMGSLHISIDTTDSDSFSAGPHQYSLDRTKRSLPVLIEKVLRTADLLINDDSYRLYAKRGGYSAAKKDFEFMQPSRVRAVGTTRYGRVGDRTVVLYQINGRAGINIWTNKHVGNPNEWRRINYID